MPFVHRAGTEQARTTNEFVATAYHIVRARDYFWPGLCPLYKFGLTCIIGSLLVGLLNDKNH